MAATAVGPAAAAAALAGLKLADFADTELLERINDVADDDGWANSFDLTEALGIDHEHATRCVGARLGYMRRIQVVERHAEKRRLWRVTAVGNALIRGNLSLPQRAMLERLAPSARIRMIRALSQEVSAADVPLRMMARREWRRNAELRRQ